MMHRFICLIVMTLSIAACAHNSTSDQANILKPNPGLQLSQLSANAKSGQNYIYCLNCLPNNLKETSKKFAWDIKSQSVAQMLQQSLQALKIKGFGSDHKLETSTQRSN